MIAVKIDLFRLFVTWIILTSLAGVFLLALESYNPWLAILIGTLGSLGIQRYRGSNYHDLELPQTGRLLLFAILCLAALLRLDPSNYIIGGQDQGLYVLKAQHYNRAGSDHVTDRVRQTIKSSPLLNFYDRNNQGSVGIESDKWFKDKKHEGSHHTGIYIEDLEASRYVFQFYPLNSIWISLFSTIFGEANGTWSTVFFGVFTVLLGYAIVYTATHSSTAAIVTATLFATNSLHIFFSRFPVAEMCSQAFFLLTLFFLVKYVRVQRNEYLVFSVLAAACLFLTRISGFILLPFFLGLLVIALCRISLNAWAKPVAFYCLSIFLAFGLSMLYGYTHSFPYFHSILTSSFVKALGDSWQFMLILITIGSILTMVACCSFGNRFYKQVDWLLDQLPKLLLLTIIIVSALAIYKIYGMAFTEKYFDTHLHKRWQYAGQGFSSLKYATMYIYMLFITPTGLILTMIGIWRAFNQRNVYATSLLAIFALYWFYLMILQAMLPYLYYYARYIISELVPLTILLIGYAFSNIDLKRQRVN